MRGIGVGKRCHGSMATTFKTGEAHVVRRPRTTGEGDGLPHSAAEANPGL
jgi:hypothetical protein